MKFWDRNLKVEIETKTSTIIFKKNLDNTPFIYFTAEIDLDITDNSNIATVKLYNYDYLKIKEITVGSKINIYGGYGENLSLIYSGLIERPPLGTRTEKGTIEHTLYCSTFNDEYKGTKIDLKVSKGTKASAVIKTVLSYFDNIKIGKIELGKDLEYKDGKTIHDNLQGTLKKIAKDTESYFYISNGLIYFNKINEHTRGTFTLEKDYIMEITANEKGYTIKSLFNSEIVEGKKAVINYTDEITSITLNGEYAVTKIKHELTLKDKFYSEFQILNAIDKKENERELKIIVGGASKKQTTKKLTKTQGTKNKKLNEIYERINKGYTTEIK